MIFFSMKKRPKPGGMNLKVLMVFKFQVFKKIAPHILDVGRSVWRIFLYRYITYLEVQDTQ